MRGPSTVALGLAALLLLLLVWARSGVVAPFGAPADGDAARSPAIALAASPPLDEAAGPGRSRERSTNAGDAGSNRDAWTVQLVGVEPGVPWTAPLRFLFDDRFEARGVVDEHGTCRFTPPAAARQPWVQQLRIEGRDDRYRLVDPFRRPAALQMHGRMELQVAPIALLRGRVLGPDGNGIAARVVAFALDPDGPREPVLARTASGDDGRYTLRAPPALPLVLVAEGLDEFSRGGVRPGPTSVFAVDVGAENEDLGMPDTRRSRADLLPDAVRAEGSHREPRTVPDLRLGTAALISGRVAFADGGTIYYARVTARPAATEARGWWRELHWSSTDGLVPGAETRTDLRGGFRLRVAPGVPFELRATVDDPLLLAGEPHAFVTAPGEVLLEVPGTLVALRAVAAGKVVPGVEIDLGERTVAAGSGELHLAVGPRGARARARAEDRVSAWVELSADSLPTVDLELRPGSLAEVRLTPRSRMPLFEATVTWQLAGDAPRAARVTRASIADPFVTHVEPGRGRLVLEGEMLLRWEQEIDVPPAGFAAAPELVPGGRLTLDVRDGRGVRFAGRFELRAGDGRDVTPPSSAMDDSGHMRRGGPGVLQALGPNLLDVTLPPGDYALTIAVPGRAAVRRTVAVMAGELRMESVLLP